MATRYEKIHESPNGPGDARPTAMQIIQDEDLKGKLSGKTILITGCSSGLGIETAKALYTTDATLYLTARNSSKAKSALGDIATSPRVHILELDLNSLSSVRTCAQNFLAQSIQLNIFIANAGVMATPEGKTEDGFETQFGTNHLAHFLLFTMVQPLLIQSSTPEFQSRAIILSSIAHRSAEVDFENINQEGKYNPWIAYGQSKTACLWVANEIERRYGAEGLHAWSVQPGGVATGLMRYLPEDAKAGIAKDATLSKIFKNPGQGAATTVWGAVSKTLEGRGGKYLEDVQISKAWKSEDGEWAPGYAAWAYDQEKASRLWDLSLKMVSGKQKE